MYSGGSLRRVVAVGEEDGQHHHPDVCAQNFRAAVCIIRSLPGRFRCGKVSGRTFSDSQRSAKSEAGESFNRLSYLRYKRISPMHRCKLRDVA